MKKYLFLLLILAGITGRVQADDKKTTIIDTLHLYADTFAGLHDLDSVVKDFDVFITGENHTYLKSNAKLWVKMIKYLHQNAGVRNVLIEYGYSSGWLINQYIQTGDSVLFEVLKAYSFKELAYAYKDMMEYNKTLPSDQKLYFSGIDLERGVYSACKVLSLMIPKDKETPDSIELHVESLLSLVSYNDNKIFNESEDGTDYFNSYSSNGTIEKIITNFRSHTANYRSFLGDRFAEFERVIKGLEDVQTWTSYEDDNATHQFIYREKYMYDRYLEEYKSKGEKFFGQFGRCHSATSIQEENSCNWYNFKSLAHRIQSAKDQGIRQKVFSIGILYNESIEDEGWKNVQEHIDSIFAGVPEESIMLYNLRKDSFLNARLSDMFNFVLFNHFNPSENYTYGRDDEDDEEPDEPADLAQNGGFFAATGGLYQFDLSDLNRYFSALGKHSFNNEMYFAGFSFGSLKKKVSSNLIFNFMIPQKLAPNDSTQFRLLGFTLHSESGYNLTSKSKHWIVCPSWGLGFTNLSLEVVQTAKDPSIQNGFLGEEKFSTYFNPAFTTNGSLMLGARFKKLIASAWGGYQLDLSNKKWFAETRMRQGPETSVRGWYAGVHLGFTFLD
jgi:hypothetical protein